MDTGMTGAGTACSGAASVGPHVRWWDRLWVPSAVCEDVVEEAVRSAMAGRWPRGTVEQAVVAARGRVAVRVALVGVGGRGA